MRHIILGTAGHIDHGKSSLVKALTGVDPDRLKEEKERGITIDLGFAELLYPEDDLSVGIVDVPGHEKLISNMLAGAGGIDIVMLVIAADEGIMPQSREHLAICDLLNIKSGLIALTKADIVDADWLELVRDETADFVRGSFLEGAPIVTVSSKTGTNIELLKKEIKTIGLDVPSKSSDGLFRLPIDRVFTLKGFGTVVTGTAISGSISVDNTVEILPRQLKTKVRGLHSHGKAIPTAFAGQRVAINLQGIEKEDLQRGDMVATVASVVPTQAVDVSLELLDDAPVLKNRSLVHFYLGTSETVARAILYETEELKAKQSCFCQFRLQDPVIALSGDRFIIRRFSPLSTMGGGEILDPSPGKRRRKDGVDDLRTFASGTVEQKVSLKIRKAGSRGIQEKSIFGWIQTSHDALRSTVDVLVQRGDVYRHESLLLHRDAFAELRDKIVKTVRAFHQKNPLKPGMQKEEIRNLLNIDQSLFNFVLTGSPGLAIDKNLVRMDDFRIALSKDEESLKGRITDLIGKGGFQPPTRNELLDDLKIDQKRLSDILNLLAKEGRIVRISESIFLSAEYYEKMISLLRSFFSKKQELTVSEFRDLLQTSRKYALPCLEYLDAANITMRMGDVRKFIMKTA